MTGEILLISPMVSDVCSASERCLSERELLVRGQMRAEYAFTAYDKASAHYGGDGICTRDLRFMRPAR